MASLPFPLDFDFTSRGPYMASLPFPLDFDFIFIGPYMMME